ncbi:replication initiation protein [Catenovulum agarivorans]|uniref:replication initiation protein n=1 Tax=Catenovulum agarivorans TaxID=1172192 RepID=UPI0002DC59EA|nr:replication initiation protein [Catenovulum agarivorans]
MTKTKDISQIYKSDRVGLIRSENGNMTATMQRAFNAIILSLQNYCIEQFGDFSTVEGVLGDSVLDVEVDWVDFCKSMGWQSNNRTNAKTVISALKQAQFEWGLKEIDPKRIGFINVLSAANIEDGVLTFQIVPSVRRELLNHRGISAISYDLSLTNLAWTDKYTARIYEECLRVWRDGENRRKYTVNEFREAIDCPYTKEGGKIVWANPVMRDFKRRVLTPSQTNINETDFVDFVINIETVGRPVKFLVLNLKPRPKARRIAGSHSSEALVLNKLSEKGFINAAASYFNKLHSDETYFEQGLDEEEIHYILYVLERYESYEDKINPGGELSYFKTCLKSNVKAFEPIWAKKEQELLLERERIEKQQLLKEQEIREKIKSSMAEVKNKYYSKVADQYLAELPSEERKDLVDSILAKHLKTNPSAGRLLNEAARNAIVRMYLKENKMLNHLINKDELDATLKGVETGIRNTST